MMVPAERLADLGRLLEQDERFRIVAQHAAAALAAMTEDELAALRSDEAERGRIFQEIWDDCVEHAVRDTDMTFATWQMSMEGVVIAHVIGLWTAEPGYWRDRVKALIPVPA